MVVGVIVLFFTIKENKLRKEVGVESEASNEDEDAVSNEANVSGPLPKDVKKSLVFILMSVAFWFIAYNAVTTAFSRYATHVWGLEGGGYADCLMIATVAAIISYIPCDNGHLLCHYRFCMGSNRRKLLPDGCRDE